MKTIYMLLSGVILSLVATIAIAGLVSISNLVRPVEKQAVINTDTQQTQVEMTYKAELRQHKDDKASDAISITGN